MIVLAPHLTAFFEQRLPIERGAFACFDKAQLLRQGGKFTELVRKAVASATALARPDRAAA